MGTTKLQKLHLGDKRLDNRCKQLIKQFVKKPTASIPEACVEWKTTKAAYRFLTNKKVDPEKILSVHYQETKQRINKTKGTILVAQDTTDCDYTTHTKTKGIGYLQGRKLFGIKVHSALAISEQGVPLGLLSQIRWIREIKNIGKRRMPGKEKRPMEEKESNRWLTSVREVEKQISSQQQVVVIGDRESDIYELFAMKRAENVQLLVRAKANRYLAGTKKRLFDKLAEAPLAGTKTIQVSKNAQRAIRDVVVEIRYTAITMASKFGKGAIKAWAVMAEEKNPPDGTQPVRWRLITTIPVTTLEKAQQILDWYAKRWLIERFHYTLKSGCKIEELQLQERSRLERALSLYDIVAWQLLWITYEAREHPDASVYEIVTPDEWNVLCAMNKTKEHLPTIHEGVLLIAKLGGFLARKGDKDPGVKKLWVGWRCLTDIMRGWYLAKEKVVEKKIVGKG